MKAVEVLGSKRLKLDYEVPRGEEWVSEVKGECVCMAEVVMAEQVRSRGAGHTSVSVAGMSLLNVRFRSSL